MYEIDKHSVTCSTYDSESQNKIKEREFELQLTLLCSVCKIEVPIVEINEHSLTCGVLELPPERPTVGFSRQKKYFLYFFLFFFYLFFCIYKNIYYDY